MSYAGKVYEVSMHFILDEDGDGTYSIKWYDSISKKISSEINDGYFEDLESLEEFLQGINLLDQKQIVLNRLELAKEQVREYEAQLLYINNKKGEGNE